MVMAALTTALCVAFSPKGALRARAPAIRMGVMPQIAVGDALPDEKALVGGLIGAVVVGLVAYIMQ